MAEETKRAQAENSPEQIQAPVYVRPNKIKVFGLLLIFVALVVAGFSLVQHIEDNRPLGEPLVLTVDDLVIAMDNAPKTAAKTYTDQYVVLTGKFSRLDSQGDYVQLKPLNEMTIKTKVAGRINDEQFDYLKTLEIGDTVTLTGKITNVGTILGIFLTVDEIEK